MKKIYLIGLMFLLSITVKSQGLIISSPVKTASLDTIINCYLVPNFNVSNMLKNGSVICELNFYKSKMAYKLDAEPIAVIIENDSIAKYTLKTCEIFMMPTDIIKNSGQSTIQDVVILFFSKLQSYLLLEFKFSSTFSN